jgi:hypothetical protein
MKAGPYCGYSLDEIIDIKQKEERRCGKFFWGYGGVFCRPQTVQVFASYAGKRDHTPVVLFSETASAFTTEQGGRFTSFSQDKINWLPLDERILLVGNTKVPHFAITAKNLRTTDSEINTGDYLSFTGMGMFSDLNKCLDDYFRYRVDKVCGVYSHSKNKKGKRIVKVSYAADLVEPYCVYIK